MDNNCHRWHDSLDLGDIQFVKVVDGIAIRMTVKKRLVCIKQTSGSKLVPHVHVHVPNSETCSVPPGQSMLCPLNGGSYKN